MAKSAINPDLAEARKRKSGYEHELSHYTALYETSLRGIHTWLAKGRAIDPPDLPPLDDPAALLLWWPRHMRHRPPARLLHAAKRAGDAGKNRDSLAAPVAVYPGMAAAEPVAAAAMPAIASPAMPPALDLPAEGADTSVEDLRRAIRFEEDALKRLQARYASFSSALNPDENELSLLETRIQACFKNITECRRRLTDDQLKRRELIALADIRAELAPLLSRMHGALVNDLVAHLSITRPAATDFADHWFATLRETRFYTHVTAPPAA